MSTSAAVAAVDLGATSGRVILGSVADGRIHMRHVARFPNQPVRLHEGNGPGLHWNITELYRSLTAGLARALREEPELKVLSVELKDEGEMGRLTVNLEWRGEPLTGSLTL